MELAASVAIALLLANPLSAIQPAGKFEVPVERVVPRDLKVERLGQPIQSTPATQPGLVWSTTVPRTIAWGTALRVHLNARHGDANPWHVRVKDANGREVERVDGATLQAAGDWWTDLVPTGTATIELWVDAGGSQASIEIDQYAFRVTPAIQQAIVGRNDMRDITDPSVPARVRAKASPIARLRFMVPDGEAVCTGFLVGTDLLLTNEHCINNDDQARTALVEFNYDTEAAATRRFRVVKVEAFDFALDYSLLRLSASAAQQNRLYLATSPAVDQRSLFVVEHPGGKPKKAVFQPNCAVEGEQRAGRDGTNTDFGHICDTEGGSSGSPVIDWATGQVVGLHHLGFVAGRDEPVNQAVHIGAIVSHLRGRVSDAVIQEITRTPQ